MTRAVLFEDAAGRITGVSVKGHSGYAEEGSDIVCAGISTLLITIDQALCSLVGLSPSLFSHKVLRPKPALAPHFHSPVSAQKPLHWI